MRTVLGGSGLVEARRDGKEVDAPSSRTATSEKEGGGVSDVSYGWFF